MYYFIFGINNSGTTVVSQYLAAQTDGYLPPFGNFEGQQAPAVKAMFRTAPWRKNKDMDWALIRAEWDRLLADSGKEVFIEASPPMIMWAARALDMFGPDARGVLLVANPYMQIASCLKNYAKPPLDTAKLEKFALRWVRKARHQAHNRATLPDVPLVTYELFCADPTVVNRAFDIPVRPLPTRIAGKGGRAHLQEQAREIEDLSIRTMAFLTPDEITALTQELSAQRELIEGFGYTMMSARDFAQRLAGDPKQAAAGQAARRKWEHT